MYPARMSSEAGRQHDAADAADDFDTSPGVWRRLLQNKFRIMENHLDVLEKPVSLREAQAIRLRLERVLRHAGRALVVRAILTTLLVLAAGSTAISAALSYLSPIPGAVDFVQLVAAYAAAFTIVLLAARILADRYLDIVQTITFMLSIEVAAAHAAAGSTGSSPG